LPFRIEPWELIPIIFRIEKDDEKIMKDILIKDMEDNVIAVTPGSKWVRARK